VTAADHRVEAAIATAITMHDLNQRVATTVPSCLAYQ
jgi:hypothetical protein